MVRQFFTKQHLQHNYHMTQQLHSWVFIPEKWKLKLIHIFRSLLIRAKKWSQPRSFNWWMVKQTVAHPNHGILCSNKKEHHWYIHRPDWIFRALCWVDKANPQGLHTVWFYSCCFLVAQSCLTLCDRMDCSPPGSSVHGILQTRILEWVAMLSFRGSSQPRDRTRISCVSSIGR